MLSGPPEKRYIIVFAIELCISIGWATYHEIVNFQDDGISGLVLRIADRADPLIVVLIAVTFVVGEGVRMFAERYLRHRYEVGKKEGRVERNEEIIRLIQEKAANGSVDVADIVQAIRDEERK